MQGEQKTSATGRQTADSPAPRMPHQAPQTKPPRLRRLRVTLRWSCRGCRRAGAQLHARTALWMQHHTRLRRRLRWCALVMLSRRRVVEFPLLGPLNINGVRLWLLCIVLTVGVLIRES